MRFAPIVALALVAVAPLAGALELRGWLEWVHKVEMRAVENGVVEEVPVNAGQHVRAGELLLRMDQRDLKAALLAARAQVARAKIGSEKAERELVRTQELYERGLIAQEEMRDAELQQAAALAEEEAARAAEAAAEVALERTELRAPFDGIVVARNAWKGDVIYKTLQQTPLIVIAPDDKILARALVTANVLRRFAPGQPARVNVQGELRPGQVYSLGVEAVRVELQGAVYYLDVLIERRPGELLRPSETVQIYFPDLR
ncbi:MAG: efflux RND transporter periplasmic adaptor subunit [Chromatiaceae bacterium]|nr:efflux RND transporter periplasmic adaptor subunit [Chromatiaceae bacterium]